MLSRILDGEGSLFRRYASKFLLVEAEAVVAIVFDSLRLVDNNNTGDWHRHVTRQRALRYC